MSMHKLRLFFKNVWNAIVGMSVEIVLAFVFILTGLLVCLFWWGVFR